MSHHDSSRGLPPWGEVDLVVARGDDPGGGGGGGFGGGAGLGAGGDHNFMDLDEMLDVNKVRARVGVGGDAGRFLFLHGKVFLFRLHVG